MINHKNDQWLAFSLETARVQFKKLTVLRLHTTGSEGVSMIISLLNLYFGYV